MNTIGTIRELKDPVPQKVQMQAAQAQMQVPQIPQVPEMGDNIRALPVDNEPVSETDNKILTTFFTSASSAKVIAEFKDAIMGGFLFFILNVPQVDEIIAKFVTYKSPYIILLVKTCIFVIAFYLCKNVTFTVK